MKIGVLIFSRFDSTRLPGKALLEVNGRALLGRVIDRSKQLKGVDGVAVATTDRSVDDPIVDFSLHEGVKVYRGDTEDVANRAIQACLHFGWDVFVRICGDRPFFDFSIVNAAIEKMSDESNDLITTSGEFMLPPGLTTEVVSVAALEKHHHKYSQYHKEHLTSYIYDQAKMFSIKYIDYPDISKYVYPTKLVIDTEEDLQRANWIAKEFEMADENAEQSAETMLNLAKFWDENHSAKAF